MAAPPAACFLAPKGAAMPQTYPPLHPKPRKPEEKIELQRLQPLMNRWAFAGLLIFIGMVIGGVEASVSWLTAPAAPIQQARGPR
jgi:hypothetical protein